jgi:transposase
MARIQSWEVSEEFWKRAEKLIPKKQRDKNKEYKRKPGGGRKSIDPRKIFEGILFVLRTGIQWKALPKEVFGSPSAIHRYFQEWEESGFFLNLWEAGLAEYDEMEGISWEWQSADGALNKSPMGKEKVGKNPTDRGKKWSKKKSSYQRKWTPSFNRRKCSK